MRSALTRAPVALPSVLAISHDELTGEQHLCLELVIGALIDVERYPVDDPKAADALAWIDGDEAPVLFADACEILHVAPSALQFWVREHRFGRRSLIPPYIAPQVKRRAMRARHRERLLVA